LDSAARSAQAIGYTPRATLIQRDTFFKVASGKLKLRQEEGAAAALIHYRRTEASSLMFSDYEIIAVSEPERMRAMLADALGVIAVVAKRRRLLMRDNVRLHLDEVEGLGTFGEIEAVISRDEELRRSNDAVEELLDALGVARSGLIDVSYFELALALEQH
jgi:predicted adenylyl cyclase CyaB